MPRRIASIRYAHPEWIVRALRQSLVAHGRTGAEIDELLEADNAAPVVNLVALPGCRQPGRGPGRRGHPRRTRRRIRALQRRRPRPARLGPRRKHPCPGCRLAARGPRHGRRRPRHGDGSAAKPRSRRTAGGERWLDLCAGPGGKAALLGALARQRGAHLLANESAPHRAKLVRQALSAVPHDAWEVRTGDGRDIGSEQPESFDRVLVDVPCTGLGALRRRPESRWRRTPKDLVDLGPLQRQLLNSALDAVKPGGVVAYVTCSPHPAETTAVVSDALRKREDLELLDAGAVLDGVSLTGDLGAGHELTAQLWPHVHQTDAMFLALIHKKA